MNNEYQDMKVWQLCQKLATGEWDRAFHHDANTIYFIDNGNIWYEQDYTFGRKANLLQMDVNETIEIKEYVPPVEYDLTFQEACEKLIDDTSIKPKRKRISSLVNEEVYLKINGFGAFEAVLESGSRNQIGKDDLLLKWRVEE